MYQRKSDKKYFYTGIPLIGLGILFDTIVAVLNLINSYIDPTVKSEYVVSSKWATLSISALLIIAGVLILLAPLFEILLKKRKDK